MQDIAQEDPISILLMYMGNMEVEVQEEYQLLDFGALLAAVGGFVGMILGWSAKDLVDLMPKKRKVSKESDE